MQYCVEHLLLEVMIEGQLGRKGGNGSRPPAGGCHSAGIRDVHPVCPVGHSQAICMSVPGYRPRHWGIFRSQEAESFLQPVTMCDTYHEKGVWGPS